MRSKYKLAKIVHFFGVAFGHEVHLVILAVKVVLTEGERVVVVIRQLQVLSLGMRPKRTFRYLQAKISSTLVCRPVRWYSCVLSGHGWPALR